MKSFLALIVIDASILEETMKLNPAAIVSSVIIKLTRNNLMNILLEYNEERYIGGKIRVMDKDSYLTFINNIKILKLIN